jgi:hypothetical protein
MNTTHVTTEAAISTRKGTSGDFADFAIRSPDMRESAILRVTSEVRPQIAF